MLTDSELLAKYAFARDEVAFAELARRHAAMVYRVCLRVLADPHDAEDAAQATFIVLARKAASLKRDGNVAAWLHGVARRTALHAIRERTRRARREEELAMLTAANSETELPPEVREDMFRALDSEIDSLPARQRQAVLLRYLEGHSEAEAAQIAGCAVGTLSGNASAGMAKLRERMSRREKALSVSTLTAFLAGEAQAGAPESLLPSILSASKSAVAGATAGAAGVKAAALAEGVVKAMLWSKMKLAALVVLAVVAGTVGAAFYQAAKAAEPRNPAKAAPPSEADEVAALGLKRIDLPYGVLMTNCGETEAQEVTDLLSDIEKTVRGLSGGPLRIGREKCILYYCRTRGEYARLERSILRTESLPPEAGCLGGYFLVSPARVLGSVDVGPGSLGFGFTLLALREEWPESPLWLERGLVRLMTPTGLQANKGRHVKDVFMLVAKRLAQEGKMPSWSDMMAGKVNGMRKVKLFPKEDDEVGLEIEEVAAQAFVKWINQQRKLPEFYLTLRKGGPPADAASKVLGKAPDHAEKEFMAWLREYPDDQLFEEPEERPEESF